MSLPNSFSTNAGSDVGNAAQPAGKKPAPFASLPPLPGDLGKYVVRREIGRGGMGVVYEGEDTLLERSVAIKWLVPQSAEPLAVDRLLREARWAARLHHPNVVAVYDAGEHHRGVFIALELVRGQSAYDHLQTQGAFAWRDATQIVAEVCQGLAAAHAAGLIHRDIKPANILLVAAADPEKHRGMPGMHAADTLHAQPWAKLSDFGLSRSVHYTAPATVEGQVVGTPHYMSPEQIRGEQLDQRTDLYSLGATYFTLLTGRFPYERDDIIQTLFAHCSAALPDPRALDPSLPSPCAAIIARCLAKEPRNRYSSAAELLLDLNALLAGHFAQDANPAALVVTPAKVDNSARAHARSHQRLWLTLAVAAVAIVALLLAIAGKSLTTASPAASSAEAVASDLPRPERPALPMAGMTISTPWTSQQNGTILTDGEMEFMRLAPDGKTLAWGTSEGEPNTGRLTLFDIERQAVVGMFTDDRRYASFSSIAFPNERYLLLAASSRVIAIDRQTNVATTLIEHSDGSARSIDVSPNGRHLAHGVVEWSGGGRVELYDLIFDEDGPRIENRRLANREHRHPVKCVAISSDGQYVGSADDQGQVILGDLLTGKTVQAHSLPESNGDGAELGYALQFSPDGKWLAAGGNRGIVTWDVASGAMRQLPAKHGRGIMALAFSPDSKFIASGSTDGIRIWNVNEGWQAGRMLAGHDGNVITGMAFAQPAANESAPDHWALITSGFDRRIHFVNLGRLKRSVNEE